MKGKGNEKNLIKNLSLESDANMVDIRSKTLLFSNDIFKIFEGYITVNKIEQAVYLLQLRFFDGSSLISNEFEVSVKSLYSEIDEHNTSSFDNLFLKRLGYFIKSEENLLYFAYAKDKKTMLVDSNFDKLKGNTLASLQLLYDLAHIVKELHTKNRKLSLIHSNLFFLNTEDKTLHYMDFLFDIVIDKIDKSSNFQIANFFGFFDMDFAESLENNETEYLNRSLAQNLKQSQYHSNNNFLNKSIVKANLNNKVYVKSDVVMLCVFTVWLFSNEAQDSTKPISFEKVVFDLQKDYLLENKLFSNFLINVKDYKIVNFIQNCLSLDYRAIKDVNFFMSEIKALIERELEKNNCKECSVKKVVKDEDNKLKLKSNQNKSEKNTQQLNSDITKENKTENLQSHQKELSKENKTENLLKQNKNSNIILEISKSDKTDVDKKQSSKGIQENVEKQNTSKVSVSKELILKQNKLINKTNDSNSNILENYKNKTIYGTLSMLSRELDENDERIIERQVLKEVFEDDSNYVDISNYQEKKATQTETKAINNEVETEKEDDSKLFLAQEKSEVINEKQDFDQIRLSIFKRTLDYTDLVVYCESCFRSKENAGIQKTHKETLKEKYEKYSAVLRKIKGIYELVPELQDKEIRDYYNKNVMDVMRKICEVNEALTSVILVNDEKINSLLHYFETILRFIIFESIEESKKCVETYSNEIEQFNEEIETFYSILQESLQIDYLSLLKYDTSSRQGKLHEEERKISESFMFKRSEFTKKFFKKLSENSKYNNLKDISEKAINNTKFLVKNLKKVRINLDFEAEMINTLDILKGRIKIFNEKLKDKTLEDFTNSMKDYRFTNPYISDNAENDITMFEEINSTLSFPEKIGSLDFNTMTLFVYNISNNGLFKYGLNKNVKFKFSSINSSSRYLNIKNKLVITGGKIINSSSSKKEENTKNKVGQELEEYKNSIDFAFYVSLSELKSSTQTYSLDKLPPMISPRSNHSCVRLSEFTFIVVGGEYTKTCEEYSFLLKRWIPKSDLPNCIFDSTIFLHNNTNVYIFFGKIRDQNSGKIDYFNSILKLSLYSKSPSWKTLEVKNENLRLNLNISRAAVVEQSENKLLILGGVDGSKCQSIFFDCSSNALYGSDDKKTDNYKFFETAFIQIKDNESAVFDENNDIVFQIVENRVFG